MSNPSYGPSGEHHATFPLNGQAAGSDPRGYGAPSPVSMPSMPGRGPAVATLILGVVLMIVIAPIAFVAAMLYGIASTPGKTVQGGTTDNGSVVTVTADGHFTVKAVAGKDPECSLIDSSGTRYRLDPYGDNGKSYVASGVPAGQYKLQCVAATVGTKVIAYNTAPEAVTQIFVMPFLWGTIVGVAGVIAVIVGIVLLVRVNGKRRRIAGEAMTGAVR